MNFEIENLSTKETEPIPRFEIRRENSLEFIARSIVNYENIGDEEAIFMLALTLDHPEMEGEIFRQIKEYKPHIHDPEKILARIREDYSVTKKELSNKIDEKDSVWWQEHLPEAETRVANLLSYFHPSPEVLPKKIIIVPSDQILSSKDTGRSFHVGDTTIILSHTENLDNFEHEFLHRIINPLTEGLADKIPQEKVVLLASKKLKEEKMYGNHALSLLNEELIRTYNDLIKSNKPIRTFTNFEMMVGSLSEEQFLEILNTESQTKKRFSTMGITSLTQLQSKKNEYWERYGKNELQERIYRLYEKFNFQKIKNPEIRFEKFLSGEISDALF